jgi:hypothetical protein
MKGRISPTGRRVLNDDIGCEQVMYGFTHSEHGLAFIIELSNGEQYMVSQATHSDEYLRSHPPWRVADYMPRQKG